MSLVDIHKQLDSHDAILEKEASAELEKLAEEDAAGRIMARGFMDELHKLAQGPAMGPATRMNMPAGAGEASSKKPMPGLMRLGKDAPKYSPPKPAAPTAVSSNKGGQGTGASPAYAGPTGRPGVPRSLAGTSAPSLGSSKSKGLMNLARPPASGQVARK